MQLFTLIEFLLASLGVTLSFFIAFILIARRNRTITNLFLATYLLAFGLRVAKSLFHNYIELPPTLRTYFLTTLFCIGPSIWIFTLYKAKGNTAFNKKDWKHFVPFIILLAVSWLIPNDGSSQLFAIFYNATIVHIFSYVVYSNYWYLKKEISYNKTHETLWIKSFLVANLIIIVWYWLVSALIVPYYLGIAFSYSILITVFSIWAIKTPTLFQRSPKKYSDSSLTKIEAELILRKLDSLMMEEKPFLNSELNLTKLGEMVGSSPKELSQAINQMLQINYSQYVVKFRVDEAKKMLKDPQYAHYKISAIAYESGFNSISSFNSLFKNQVGITAKTYRAENSESSLPES